MKAVSLLSGGKDSFLSAVIAMESGMDIEYALIVQPEKDSPMFHVPNIGNAALTARLLGLEAREIRESEFDSYFTVMHDSGIEAIVSGATASDYQHSRIEKLCTLEKMISFSPLWRLDPYLVLEELLLRKISAIIVSVSAEGLDESYLGRSMDENFISDIARVERKYKVNPLGEGGEYESFVTGMHGNGSITIKDAKKVWTGSSGYLELKCTLEGS
ncbi:MAG: diphthine--ammonia ligase [Candidatus Thermoplasmatota archaeon]|nr:diphthine--ammonia ligase [Candidatus Thermoplasmatota archaeon]